jgi:hypothetical protein
LRCRRWGLLGSDGADEFEFIGCIRAGVLNNICYTGYRCQEKLESSQDHMIVKRLPSRDYILHPYICISADISIMPRTLNIVPFTFPQFIRMRSSISPSSPAYRIFPRL